eukprot:10876606-Alexandrium_andersonii.AAC.1
MRCGRAFDYVLTTAAVAQVPRSAGNSLRRARTSCIVPFWSSPADSGSGAAAPWPTSRRAECGSAGVDPRA